MWHAMPQFLGGDAPGYVWISTRRFFPTLLVFFTVNAIISHGPCLKAGKGDGFPTSFTCAILSIVHGLETAPDFVNQSALPFTKEQGMRAALFRGGTIKDIRFVIGGCVQQFADGGFGPKAQLMQLIFKHTA